MLTPEQVQGLQVAFERITQPITEYLIKDISRRVADAGQLTSTAAYQIERLKMLNVSIPEVKKRVAELLEKELDEVESLFRQAAEVGYNFDISRLDPNAVPFADNLSMQQIVEAAVKLAREDLTNITQTMGFEGVDGVTRELSDAYTNATDYAFNAVSTGAMDYTTAIERACRQLANKGIQTIDYKSNVHTSLEAAVRRNMMGGLGLMVEKITQKNHDDLGCDGWEISAHAASAPDHEPIQGKQYPDAEYQRLNDSLVRRIGTLNCGHNAMPIIIGVNEPQYTRAELEQFRRDNAKGVSFEGKQFKTVYEATQYQRKIERAIRAQKRRQTIAENQRNTERAQQAKTRLKVLQAEYRRFCKATGLRTQDERLFVAGWR